MDKPKKIKLHLGCGLTAPVGWVNVDGSWNARLARYGWLKRVLARLALIPARLEGIPWPENVKYHDLRHPLPFADNTASAVYASHLLEHLYTDEAIRLLREAYRVLIPVGVIRLMVPDLEALAREYLRNLDQAESQAYSLLETPGDVFMRQTGLRSENAPRGSFAYRIYQLLTEFENHKWMYDRMSLISLLRNIGFTELDIAERHKSRIAEIQQVETNQGLIVEGIKPHR